MGQGSSDLVIRAARRAELDLVVEWAAQEAWNPGLFDAECFYAADTDVFCSPFAPARLCAAPVMFLKGPISRLKTPRFGVPPPPPIGPQLVVFGHPEAPYLTYR